VSDPTMNGESSDAAAFAPRISPEGNRLTYLSVATGLGGDLDRRLRGFLYDLGSGETVAVGEWREPVSDAVVVVSPSWDQVATAMPRGDGWMVMRLTDTTQGSSSELVVKAASGHSATVRGWAAVGPQAVSDDGQYLAMLAWSPSEDGSPSAAQVYRLDTTTGERECVSLGAAGAPTYGHRTPYLSRDGTRLTYRSSADNLVKGESRAGDGVYAYDWNEGRLLAEPQEGVSEFFVSPDGRRLVTERATLRQVSVGESGTTPRQVLATSLSGRSVFSRDSRWLALLTSLMGVRVGLQILDVEEWVATGDTNAIRWTTSGNLRDALLSADGSRIALTDQQAAGMGIRVVELLTGGVLFVRSGTLLSGAALDDAGRHLVWTERGSADGVAQLYHVVVDTGDVSMVTVAADGVTPGDGNSRYPALSGDGRYLAFASNASNLTDVSPSRIRQLYLRDLVTGRTLLVSRGFGGEPAIGMCTSPFFSGDGRSLFFRSHAANLLTDDLNGAGDLFKVSILSSEEGLLLVLRRPLLSGGPMTLEWSGAAGHRYRVERRRSLEPGPWELLAEPEGISSLEVQAEVGVSAFYRVSAMGSVPAR